MWHYQVQNVSTTSLQAEVIIIGTVHDYLNAIMMQQTTKSIKFNSAKTSNNSGFDVQKNCDQISLIAKVKTDCGVENVDKTENKKADKRHSTGIVAEIKLVGQTIDSATDIKNKSECSEKYSAADQEITDIFISNSDIQVAEDEVASVEHVKDKNKHVLLTEECSGDGFLKPYPVNSEDNTLESLVNMNCADLPAAGSVPVRLWELTPLVDQENVCADLATTAEVTEQLR